MRHDLYEIHTACNPLTMTTNECVINTKYRCSNYSTGFTINSYKIPS